MLSKIQGFEEFVLAKLLLLEDDPLLSKTLIRYLENNDYKVDWAKTGEEAMEMSYDHTYDLYLFDINVPLISGIDLLTELRDAEDFTPAIIISALQDTASVTRGFIAGADDYLKKPFEPEELLVRIKAKTDALRKELHIKGYSIDLQKEEIRKEGKLLFLGAVQKSLLLALFRHYPNPATKETLMDLLEKPTDLALRVNIAKIKKALGIDIRNVRGVGYQII